MPAVDLTTGKDKTVDDICRLPPALLAESCRHILIYLQGQSRGVDSVEISQSFHGAGIKLDHEALQSIIRLLLVTFRTAGKSGISGDQLVQKLEEGSKKWSKASLEVIHRSWCEHGALVQARQELQDTLGVGQLVDLQWNLSLAVSSDTCRSLNSPFVTLLLKIAEPSGHIIQRTFEMSVPQFQNLHKQFKEMAALMDTV